MRFEKEVSYLDDQRTKRENMDRRMAYLNGQPIKKKENVEKLGLMRTLLAIVVFIVVYGLCALVGGLICVMFDEEPTKISNLTFGIFFLLWDKPLLQVPPLLCVKKFFGWRAFRRIGVIFLTWYGLSVACDVLRLFDGLFEPANETFLKIKIVTGMMWLPIVAYWIRVRKDKETEEVKVFKSSVDISTLKRKKVSMDIKDFYKYGACLLIGLVLGWLLCLWFRNDVKVLSWNGTSSVVYDYSDGEYYSVTPSRRRVIKEYKD